jgi:hypothetical protein
MILLGFIAYATQVFGDPIPAHNLIPCQTPLGQNVGEPVTLPLRESRVLGVYSTGSKQRLKQVTRDRWRGGSARLHEGVVKRCKPSAMFGLRLFMRVWHSAAWSPSGQGRCRAAQVGDRHWVASLAMCIVLRIAYCPAWAGVTYFGAFLKATICRSASSRNTQCAQLR